MPLSGFVRFCSCFIIAGLVFAPPAQAQSPSASGSPPRTIVVSGEGTASAPPDQARLSAGVVTQAPTADAALGANSTAMRNVFAALKKLGIPDNKMQTSNFSVSPQYPPYRQDNTEPPRIVGYQVSNQVTVTVDDLTKLGATLDVLVKNGANQLGGVGFMIADPKPLAERARRAAVVDAAAKAKTLAAAAGVTLGPVLSIQEGGGSQPIPMFMASARVAEAASPPIASGESNVNVSVTMVYAIP